MSDGEQVKDICDVSGLTCATGCSTSHQQPGRRQGAKAACLRSACDCMQNPVRRELLLLQCEGSERNEAASLPFRSPRELHHHVMHPFPSSQFLFLCLCVTSRIRILPDECQLFHAVSICSHMHTCIRQLDAVNKHKHPHCSNTHTCRVQVNEAQLK
jgi:hypothetical protein